MNRVAVLLFIAFASFLAAESRLVLDCPLPQLGQNNTHAAAFLYVDGQPATNATMTLTYVLNETFGFETIPVSVDAINGRHDFVLDIRFGGSYNLSTQSGTLSSNPCRLDVFEQQANQIPELHEWLILFVVLAAGFVAYSRRPRASRHG